MKWNTLFIPKVRKKFHDKLLLRGYLRHVHMFTGDMYVGAKLCFRRAISTISSLKQTFYKILIFDCNIDLWLTFSEQNCLHKYFIMDYRNYACVFPSKRRCKRGISLTAHNSSSSVIRLQQKLFLWQSNNVDGGVLYFVTKAKLCKFRPISFSNGSVESKEKKLHIRR